MCSEPPFGTSFNIWRKICLWITVADNRTRHDSVIKCAFPMSGASMQRLSLAAVFDRANIKRTHQSCALQGRWDWNFWKIFTLLNPQADGLGFDKNRYQCYWAATRPADASQRNQCMRSDKTYFLNVHMKYRCCEIAWYNHGFLIVCYSLFYSMEYCMFLFRNCSSHKGNRQTKPPRLIKGDSKDPKLRLRGILLRCASHSRAHSTEKMAASLKAGHYWLGWYLVARRHQDIT